MLHFFTKNERQGGKPAFPFISITEFNSPKKSHEVDSHSKKLEMGSASDVTCLSWEIAKDGNPKEAWLWSPSDPKMSN